ncbi:hypothetical protein FRC11_007738 [Ceratobasidium sp. 423]|nr:hypothetical protein FRC11_007738 [Ceratobasidium sp. 423]
MKSLTARSSAVKAALKRYNQAALELDPPAQQFTWEQISSASILSEVHILCGSCRSILNQCWTQPENWCCVEQYHQLLHAQEETQRLNIEVRWLSTAITDEGIELAKLLESGDSRNAGDQWLLRHYAKCQLKVNAKLLDELDSIKGLEGYTGWHTTGIYVSQHNTASISSDTEMEPINLSTPEAPQAKAHASCASIEDEEAEDLQVDDDIIDQFDKWQIALHNTKDLPT